MSSKKSRFSLKNEKKNNERSNKNKLRVFKDSVNNNNNNNNNKKLYLDRSEAAQIQRGAPLDVEVDDNYLFDHSIDWNLIQSLHERLRHQLDISLCDCQCTYISKTESTSVGSTPDICDRDVYDGYSINSAKIWDKNHIPIYDKIKYENNSGKEQLSNFGGEKLNKNMSRNAAAEHVILRGDTLYSPCDNDINGWERNTRELYKRDHGIQASTYSSPDNIRTIHRTDLANNYMMTPDIVPDRGEPEEPYVEHSDDTSGQSKVSIENDYNSNNYNLNNYNPNNFDENDYDENIDQKGISCTYRYDIDIDSYSNMASIHINSLDSASNIHIDSLDSASNIHINSLDSVFTPSPMGGSIGQYSYSTSVQEYMSNSDYEFTDESMYQSACTTGWGESSRSGGSTSIETLVRIQDTRNLGELDLLSDSSCSSSGNIYIYNNMDIFRNDSTYNKERIQDRKNGNTNSNLVSCPINDISKEPLAEIKIDSYMSIDKPISDKQSVYQYSTLDNIKSVDISGYDGDIADVAMTILETDDICNYQDTRSASSISPDSVTNIYTSNVINSNSTIHYESTYTISCSDLTQQGSIGDLLPSPSYAAVRDPDVAVLELEPAPGILYYVKMLVPVFIRNKIGNKSQNNEQLTHINNTESKNQFDATTRDPILEGHILDRNTQYCRYIRKKDLRRFLNNEKMRKQFASSAVSNYMNRNTLSDTSTAPNGDRQAASNGDRQPASVQPAPNGDRQPASVQAASNGDRQAASVQAASVQTEVYLPQPLYPSKECKRCRASKLHSKLSLYHPYSLFRDLHDLLDNVVMIESVYYSVVSKLKLQNEEMSMMQWILERFLDKSKRDKVRYYWQNFRQIFSRRKTGIKH